MTRHSPGPLAPSTCSRDRSGWAHFGASVSLYRLDILSPWWLDPEIPWTDCVSISAGFCHPAAMAGRNMTAKAFLETRALWLCWFHFLIFLSLVWVNLRNPVCPVRQILHELKSILPKAQLISHWPHNIPAISQHKLNRTIFWATKFHQATEVSFKFVFFGTSLCLLGTGGTCGTGADASKLSAHQQPDQLDQSDHPDQSSMNQLHGRSMTWSGPRVPRAQLLRRAVVSGKANGKANCKRSKGITLGQRK